MISRDQSEFSVAHKVLCGGDQEGGIVLEGTETNVAAVAQQPANCAGLMVMVNMKTIRSTIHAFWCATANRAFAMLLALKALPKFYINTVRESKATVFSITLCLRGITSLSPRRPFMCAPVIESRGIAFAASKTIAACAIYPLQEFRQWFELLAFGTYSLVRGWARARFTVIAPMRLKSMVANFFSAPSACGDRCPTVFVFHSIILPHGLEVVGVR